MPNSTISAMNSSYLQQEDLNGQSHAPLHLQESEEDFFIYPESIQKQALRTFVIEEHFSLVGSSGERKAQKTKIETHYTQALCLCFGKGGACTSEASSWIKGSLVTKGYPSVLIDSVDTLLEQAADLIQEEFLEDCALLESTFANNGARNVMYDLMQGASVSGFKPVVVANVLAFASLLHVNEFTCDDIRYAVTLGNQIRRYRLQNFSPTFEPTAAICS